MMLRGEYNGHRIDNTTEAETDALIEAYRAVRPRSIMIYSIDRKTPGRKATESPERRTLNGSRPKSSPAPESPYQSHDKTSITETGRHCGHIIAGVGRRSGPDRRCGKSPSVRGFNTKVMAHATGRKGTYSASAGERLDDMRSALSDPAVKLFPCSRGGYGAVGHARPAYPQASMAHRIQRYFRPSCPVAIAGIQCPYMAPWHGIWRNFRPTIQPTMHCFRYYATARSPHTVSPTHPLSRQGSVRGQMIGGNLAVLAGLISTPYDMLKPGRILVIEDIAEPIYKVERILHQLRLNGVLENLSGLLVGQFTEYRGDSNYTDMERMIADMTAPYGYPVALGAPFGHVDGNLPFVEGAEVTLNVSDSITTITPA